MGRLDHFNKLVYTMVLRVYQGRALGETKDRGRSVVESGNGKALECCSCRCCGGAGLSDDPAIEHGGTSTTSGWYLVLVFSSLQHKDTSRSLC